MHLLVEAVENLVVVGDDEDGCLSFESGCAQQFDHCECTCRIQRGGWFICKNDAGLVGERACDCNALRFTAGELGGHCVASMRHSQVIEKFVSAPLRRIRRIAKERTHNCDVLPCVSTGRNATLPSLLQRPFARK